MTAVPRPRRACLLGSSEERSGRRRVAFVGSGAERSGWRGPEVLGLRSRPRPRSCGSRVGVGAALEPQAGTFCWRSSRAAITTRDVQKAAWVPALGGGNAHIVLQGLSWDGKPAADREGFVSGGLASGRAPRRCGAGPGCASEQQRAVRTERLASKADAPRPQSTALSTGCIMPGSSHTIL